MPASCSVPDCELKYAHSEDVSYHKFPLKKPDLLVKWINFTNRGPEWTPTKWSAICSRHFKPTDFKDCIYRKNLTNTAIPSIRLKYPAKTDSIIDRSLFYEAKSGVKTSIEDAGFLQDEPSEPLYTDQDDLYTEDSNLLEITCRLCGIVFSKWCQGLLVDYREHFSVITKCLPFVNLEVATFPTKICGHCLRMINGFSSFYDNVMKTQSDFELKYNVRENQAKDTFQAPQEPPRLKIKQEPLVNIKEEAVDSGTRIRDAHSDASESTLIIKNPNVTYDNNKILLFNNVSHEGQYSKQFRESKNCEILEIVNLYPPIVDITSATITEVQPYEITLPSVANCNFQQHVTPQIINLKTEDTGESYEDHEDYPNYIQDLQSGLNTLEEHSYSKLPIQADDNKDEIFPRMKERNELVNMGETANLQVVHVDLPDKNFNDPRSSKVLKKSCQKCHRNFATKLKVIKHRMFSCNMKSLTFSTCVFCSKKYSSWIKLHVHKQFCPKRIQQTKQQCLKATKARAKLTTSNHKVVKRYKKHVTGKVHRCSMCERTYSRLFNLKRHLVSHRPVDQWNHKCGICHRIFDKLLDLKKHFQLAKCSGSGNKNVLKSEKIKCSETTSGVVGAIDRLLYVCSTCNKQFKTYNSLKVHESIHTGLKIFICETCGKCFGGQMNLTQHRLTHVDTRNFRCNLCPKVFKRRGGLGQHVKSFHMKIKPYQCSICRRNFALKADMMRCRHSKLIDFG